MQLCNVALILWKKMSKRQEEPCTITIGLEKVTKNLDNLRD